MGLMVEGNIVRKKHRENIRIALDGKQVYGMKETKYWEPNRKVQFLPVQKLETKQVVKDRNTKHEDITYERIGWCKYDKDIEETIALHNVSKTKGRIILKGKDRKYWNVKMMKYEKQIWIPKEPKMDLMPKKKGKQPMPETPEVGTRVSFEGQDYRFEGKKGGKWYLYSNGKTRKLGHKTLYKALKAGSFSVVQ